MKPTGITPRIKCLLVTEKYDVAGLTNVDEQELFMDTHGCNVVLVVCKDVGGDLVGFTYRYSSEEHFYDLDPNELFPLISVNKHPCTLEEVKKIEYKRADGEEWDL
jgi:hypothetical protein